MTKSLTALFGGTFDPIHYGHLLPIVALVNEVKLSQVSLLPNQIPPHRPQPEASPEQRLDMLKLAIEDYTMLSIDMREMSSHRLDRPSYTIETLQDWRNENGESSSLAFILGQDSLLSLATWHNWQALLNYCHLLICRRPGYAVTSNNEQLMQWIKQHQTSDIDDLHRYPNGFIYFANTPLEDISATEIREKISTDKDCQKLIPPKVWQYIQTTHLYGT